MQTHAENEAWTAKSREIVVLAESLTLALPYGVRADLGFASEEPVQRLTIRIFRDLILESVDVTREDIHAVLASQSLPSEDVSCDIVVTDIDHVKRLVGDQWEYGDALQWKPSKKRRSARRAT